MELTDEQRKQAEANRLAAIAKRKALIESSTATVNSHYQQNQAHYWRLTKCPKLSNHNTHIPQRPQASNLDPVSSTQLSKKFQVRLEICSPDSFAVTPETLEGYVYQGDEECFRRLEHILSDAIAIAGCFRNEVFGHRDNPANLKKSPKVVVISFTMLNRLRKIMLEQEWAVLVVDESHHLRCSRKASESGEIKTVLDLAEKVKRVNRPYDIFHQINMLWPGLLGETKYKFAETYCAVNFSQSSQGFKDFSKGVRLEELHLLLSQTVMIRRLKEHVMVQLPPKRRQVIRLQLKKSDIASAKAAISLSNGDAFDNNAAKDASENLEENHDGESYCNSGELSYQELGVAKLRGFREWFSIHPLIAESDAVEEVDTNSSSHKMIIFAHHHKVLDGIQEFICEKGIGFVRIDGTTLPKDRQSAVKIAIIGITAGGVGLDFSSAQNVVFLEIPQSPSLMLQAEDRAHRRGQTNAVNIYIFCAKDTLDESNWQALNRSLHRVSSTTNGKYDAVQGIEVEGISYLVTPDGNCKRKMLRIEAPSKFSLGLEKSQDPESFPDKQPLEGSADKAVSMEDVSDGKNQTGGSYLHNDDIIVSNIQINEEFVSLGNKNELHHSAADTGICDMAPDFSMDERSEYHDPLPKVQSIKADDDAPIQLLEPECFSNDVDSLRFEVSQYTGRIHLYSCIPGTDLRPRPLFENFRPEEIDTEDGLVTDKEETVSKNFKDKPAYRHALRAFINEWNKLRPIEQRKLRGKPLQLPLSIELCYLKESVNHDSVGLLKGGSKRRTTPLCEISISLPPNAVWKKVHLQKSYSKKEKEYTQGWLNDEPLCKLCQNPCKGGSAKMPEYFEDLFCKIGCYEEYRLRTSNRFLRQELFQIEHGVCTNCQLDCHQLVKHLKPLSSARRQEYIAKVAPKIASQKSLYEKLVSDPSEGNAWHADHIVPVYRGGGECRLENMRTLCVACHADVTAAQCAERRLMRIKAKNKLKSVLNELRNSENTEMNAPCRKDQGPSEIIDDIAMDELLVTVPGSAYSGGESSIPQTEELNDSPEFE
ncbi:SNF2-related protein [Corchorus olitorius]|uniref:SNF2-related protein n=1 Tax=Corchorus olitorius TaxID=93759 RepID=A0A1R3G4I8_9ROSI|nr:SNF2-related protein [Corchorus olitorius]